MCSPEVQRQNLSLNVNPLRELAIAGINFASGFLDGRSLNTCAKEAILRCRKTVAACACSANSKGQNGLKADLECDAASCGMVVSSTSGCRCGRAWRIGGSAMETPNLPAIRALRPAWNKGRIVGQKRPLKPKHVWAIRVRLELAENHRDLALFNLAIDSKLRGCDLVKMKVVDVMASGQIKERASVLQSKTQKPVRFEISEGTRASLERWMQDPLMVGSEYLWPGRFHERLHISTRQYARIVRDWVTSIGLEASAYGTHSMRRTKVTQIYKKTGNLRAVQLLLGHTKMDSTVRYLGVELEDALAIAEAIEI
jgi:integrase